MFGELFDEASRQGVAPAITQHPGFYFYGAGRHALSRRAAAIRCRPLSAVTHSASAPPGNNASQPASPPGDKGGYHAGVAVRLAGGEAPQQSAAQQGLADVSLEFYGQQAWRSAGQTIDTIEPARVMQGIAAVQAKEANVAYSVGLRHLFCSKILSREAGVQLTDWRS